jgi:hypothetical protein
MKVYRIGKIISYTANQRFGMLIEIIFIGSNIKTNIGVGEKSLKWW